MSARGDQEARWRGIRAAHPGAEMEREAGAMGRLVRARLSPEGDWTPWRMKMRACLDLLEERAAGGAR